VTWAIATFVDGRAFPMFGLLFGYGVAHIVGRQTGSAWATRLLLWRRSLVLVVLGVADAMLFYVGDSLAAYGVLLFLGVWAIRWQDRWLLGVAALFFVLGALPSADSMSVSTDRPDAAMLPPELLTTTAVVGIGAAVLGAQPVALMLAGVLERPPDDVLQLIGPLHDATGVLGGIGYAALIALLSVRLAPRAGRVTTALAATGQRSLTCYLCQSVVWAIVFAPYLLDLSDTLTVTTTALLAVATWLATVLLADRMRRSGNRGPFEVLIRRVTYGAGVGRGSAQR